ncbi:DUF5107 domain-containing protein [Nonomuraea sp. WAC 01424]|uniref:DUF5107 domain-containing protein n=1 Tax=Nonomuraea sp. WAC 01424 TaxID=2203200 RepID=UPI000F7923EB|nr:DUF5107 domain-containing protein [Nonomuraea sp. WAC 01424]RSN11602.1 DUF5107 domain-containing protein [Nonomuraea sp. WAC 01424]
MKLTIADAGPVSPLPILRPPAVAIPDFGHPPSLLPYARRDSYDRDPAEREVPSVTLENEHLRAVFLPGLGGRLWSLVDLATGRELLHRNPVIQPANLALRDAWFAGGVEWNLGTTGHWALTCDPLHAAWVEAPYPVLRLYEYERMRGLVVQIDAALPPGSPALVVSVTIRNPRTETVPVYWWSNIAVPQSPRTRVLAPADRAEHFGYAQRLTTVPYPGEPDAGYPGTWRSAADYFFHVTSDTPWIAAVDDDGHGLLHTSTSRLKGRKLFGWGVSAGGSNWQSWLSGPGAPYLEIQAGLARTQLEHLPLPGDTAWTWTETYSPLTLRQPHAPYEQARAAVDVIARTLPWKQADPGPWTDRPVTEVIHRGSGWGALERRAGGLPESAATPFPDDTLGPEQTPWLSLLAEGRLPGEAVCEAVCVVGPRWLNLLRTAADWHGRYHLGLNLWAAGDRAGALDAWREALAVRRHPLVLRALAEAGRIDGDDAAAAVLLLEAHALAPGMRPLTVETLTALIAAGRPADALDLVDRLPAGDRAHGRVRLLEARAALSTGDRARTGRILDAGLIVPDLREGEDALDDLWFAHHGRDSALPPAYDFRMD